MISPLGKLYWPLSRLLARTESQSLKLNLGSWRWRATPLTDDEDPTDDHELPGGMLGSSIRLRAELIQVAPALGISLTFSGDLADAEAERINALGESDEGLYRELTSWIALYEASRISIEHRTAIVFS